MSTFHPAASSLANFNDTISTISTTQLFIYISCSHQDKNQFCHGITAHTLWRFHGEHQVNTESFWVLLPAEYAVMYTCYKRGVTVLGVWSIFFPFIIKRILGIKCIVSCSFRNKCMRLLTRVYGIRYKWKIVNRFS